MYLSYGDPRLPFVLKHPEPSVSAASRGADIPGKLEALCPGIADVDGSCFRISSRTVALMVSSRVVSAEGPAVEPPAITVELPVDVEGPVDAAVDDSALLLVDGRETGAGLELSDMLAVKSL